MATARVIFSTGSLHGHDIAYCFGAAAEAGFDGMEILCDDRWSTRDPHYLQRLSREYSLPVLALHTPYATRVMGWQKPGDPLQRIHQTLRLAETLGAETMVVHSPTKVSAAFLHTPTHRFLVPWRSPFGAVKSWIEQDLPEFQQRTTVKIAIENNPAVRFMGRSVDPSIWPGLDQWAAAHQWLTLDTTHWATKGVQPLEAYAAGGQRVCHIHLSNFEEGRQHRLPHRGQLDLGAFLRRLAADGFAGTICLELYPDALGFEDDASVRRNLRESLDFCREHLGQPMSAAQDALTTR
jgi:sugar phosphate isomerase/epimerase